MAEQKWKPSFFGDPKEEDVANKTAVALAYDPADMAPKILATGKGHMAQKIIDAAKENDVPLHKDNKLAETLSALEIGDTIPPELYSVVAEILVHVNDMEKIKKKLDGVM